MTTDEAFADIRPQLDVAARLGFGAVRATLGMEPALVRRVLAEAERLGVVLTFELQGATAPDAPAVIDVLALREETGSPYLGFTLDFSLTTPALPAAFGTALRGSASRTRRSRRAPRLGRTRTPGSGRPSRRSPATATRRPPTWSPACSAGAAAGNPPTGPTCCRPSGTRTRSSGIRTVESVRTPHGAWLSALAGAGYRGAVVSEWGGHELLDRADADALAVTRAAPRPAVRAGRRRGRR